MNNHSATRPPDPLTFRLMNHRRRDRNPDPGRVPGPSELRFLVASLLVALLLLSIPAAGQEQAKEIISAEKKAGALILASSGSCAPLVVCPGEWPGVTRALADLQNDLSLVTGAMPDLINASKPPRSEFMIIAGTIGKSAIIDRLIKRKKIDAVAITGKWESFIIETVEKPFPGVKQALVIAGSDKRGTIYGIYEISGQAGVSPWYWWADVPVRKNSELYVIPGRHAWGEPSVKYRGIFLNDEYPALTKWVAYKYGNVTPSANPPVPPDIANYGSEFYSRIFEVLLRLKANYLWPAMWNNAFNEDDVRNASLADEYGIVMGTSHQEPMIRAQKEWDRRYQKTLGSWSWTHHEDTLLKFWRDGIRRNRDYESIITIGLRGADDTEMGPGGSAANIARLEKIVKAQRGMIAEEINPDVAKVPQMWCLYKEVQDYYHEGMRVPDDVTLLWAEDNWGNVRRLPTADERKRSGGAGVYYHFDYHGGPRSYQWINTSPIPKIWDQMSLAKQYGADRIWIANVGHFRGYEIPLEYFLDLAWDAGSLGSDDMPDWTQQWAADVFGPVHAGEISEIIREYTRFNGRRKPELLSPFTYSLVNYGEAERIVEEYKMLAERAEKTGHLLPAEMEDAYFHLVLFPVKACALVNELYVTAGKNALYASQGRANAGDMTVRTEKLFTADTALMGYYNRVYAGGRWRHFMDQAHLGYTAWNDPPENSLRHINLARPAIPEGALPAIALEGSTEAWPGSGTAPILPGFDVFNHQTRYIEVFNRGSHPFEYTATSDKPWITLGNSRGTVTDQQRIIVTVDWEALSRVRNDDPASADQVALCHSRNDDPASADQAALSHSRNDDHASADRAALSHPRDDDHASADRAALTQGLYTGTVTVSAGGNEMKIGVTAFKPVTPDPVSVDGFVEADGYVSMEAASYTGRHDTGGRSWEQIEDYGRTSSGMRASAFTDAPPAVPGKDSPVLEYKMYLFSAGEFETVLHMAPSLNFLPDRDFRIGLSIDEGEAQLITVVPAGFNAENFNREWEETVRNSTRYVTGKIKVAGPGSHTLKVWMIDPGMVLEKIVINTGDLRPSYLGPPESHKN